MLNKLNLYCWLVAITVMICGSFYCKYITQQYGVVKSELKTCQKELKGAQDAEISSGKLIKELRQKALADKPVVDCYSSPMPQYVIDELSKLK